MDYRYLQISRHAVTQMFARGISVDDIAEALRSGEAIQTYPDDRPYPSLLFLCNLHGRPLHVVAAKDPITGVCVVVTAYEPDPEIWRPDFKTRKKP